jgi:AcrR family transcriptional regulator
MSSVTTTPEKTRRPAGRGTTRMKAEERRELILAAASGVFGERGYVGTTTDAVAKAAGVSQPYVVRMFGTKAALFEAVLQRSLGTLLREFRRQIAEQGRATPELPGCIGRCYVELLADRGLLLSLMQGFMLGADPEVGPIVRAGFLEVYRVLRDEGGFSPEQAADFLAEGMMINTLVALRMGADYDSNADARELIEGAMPAKASMLRDLARS